MDGVTHSFIGGGSGNTLTNISFTLIGGGLGNTINTGSTYSSIIGGYNNTINNDVLRSSIVGGGSIVATVSDTTYVPNLEIKDGLSIPSDSIFGTGATTTNLTIEDYYVRSLVVTGQTVNYRLPTHPSGENTSRDGQILIVSVGDSDGKVSLLAGSEGAIEEPSSSTNRDEIEVFGPNSNVTLYYDGDSSKWVVTSEVGVLTYITNI
jgi:hypothetical protein